MRLTLVMVVSIAVGACSATETATTTDFDFDGTCVGCHLGLSAGHVHPNYKLRCVDCHGGNDAVELPDGVASDPKKLRDPALLAQAHVVPKPGLARFFFANGIDDDKDGKVDQVFQPNDNLNPTSVVQLGEVFQPGLHGEGPGEFLDDELNRDLNYTRFLNPGDLRVATVGCGSRSRAALDGGGGGGCHQETVDLVRRSIMVNQSAVTNGAYYGNESWRQAFISGRGNTPDPRAGAFAYALDYDGADACINLDATTDGPGGHGQPKFDSKCLEQRAAMQDATIAANAPGNKGLPAFEIAQGSIGPVAGSEPGTTFVQAGAGHSRYPWGGTPIADQTAERAKLGPIPNDVIPGTMAPDPVDLILRSFRAYYPLNYPGSTVNQNFTFGTSILPDINHFKTADPFGRTHSSGCTTCHMIDRYDGGRNPTRVLQDDGTELAVVDPTTKHREFDPMTQDRGMEQGQDELIGRAVAGQDQLDTNRAQQKGYSADHALTTAVTTDQCGLCHGFVTRINYAYQGMAEEEQRDQLSRKAPLAWTTPANTQVVVLDSWVREEQNPAAPKLPNNQFVVTKVIDKPPGLAIAELAKARDATLRDQGFIAGNGGCAANTFTEDCNNNGELDHQLVLNKLDEAGNVVATTTIDEDLNHDGKLDLIDRLPRDASVDGRQMRYVYGGRNGSTRLMDIHFERGMHCIDCHFLQDAHGDGHVYSTNWDQIEIECEDCHGASKRSTLKTSGPNGGNDLTAARDPNDKPYFEVRGNDVIQRSRVTPGLFWKVPQTADQTSPLALEAHQSQHVGEPGQGSTFAGTPGASKLTAAKVECATCHSSWVLNCVGCHVNVNVGDPQRVEMLADLHTLDKTVKENEIWFGNQQEPGHIDFQLLGLLRAPFVLGVSSSSEQGRLATFRSSMQAQVSITAADGTSIRDNLTFTTFQSTDGNSGRRNVATSGVAMNQTMPHTVRPSEARGCETCHQLVDSKGRARNEHILAETYGLGTGAIDYAGDWGIAAGTSGIELYDYKADGELATNLKGKSSRFPGLVVSDCDRDPAKVEPVFDGSVGGLTNAAIATDVVLIRNFNPTPAAAGFTQPPTLRDVAITSVDSGGGTGKLVVSDISQRGDPASVRPSVSAVASELTITLPAAARALAHLGPDVSDPFVYVAVGTAGVSVVRIDGAPTATATAAQLVRTVSLPSGHTANELQLAGDVLYVGTVEGTIDVLDLTDPANPVAGTSVAVGGQVNGLALEGFVLYAATTAGIAALQLDNPNMPARLAGATGPIILPGLGGNELVASAGRLYVAAGPSGVHEIDVRTPAMPTDLGNITAMIDPTVVGLDARDVIVSTMPGQTWLLVLDATGDFLGFKLDGKKATAERCFPSPVVSGCTLELSFLDPTQSGRDPSFNPPMGFDDSTCSHLNPIDPNFNPFTDPSAKPSFRLTHTIISTGRRLARPTMWEQIGTLTGRRYRDSFMPGGGVLSLDVMQTMRSVKVCESTGKSTAPGNLGAIGYADAAFLAGGACQPIGVSMRPAPRPPAKPTRTTTRPPIDVSPRPSARSHQASSRGQK